MVYIVCNMTGGQTPCHIFVVGLTGLHIIWCAAFFMRKKNTKQGLPHLQNGK